MKNPLVKINPHFPGHYCRLWAGDIRTLFGLSPNATLPNRFIHRVYDGPRGMVSLYIAPHEYGLVNQNNNRAHRVFAICPRCKRDIPFGRMGQHVKRKDHQDNARQDNTPSNPYLAEADALDRSGQSDVESPEA